MKIASLDVRVYPTRLAMGEAAADEVARRLRRVVQERASARVMFAAAPSQLEFFHALLKHGGIPWDRVDAFHMDEYIGLPADAPQLFGPYLRRHLFDHRPFRSVHYLNPVAADPVEECARYSALLGESRLDIVCLGIGENGHLAFNDPPVADFSDPLRVKVVELDHACRLQQVADGAFDSIEQVPPRAMTVTIPALLAGDHLSVVVPGPRKSAAVAAALTGTVATSCPASILRTHPDAVLYLDSDAARDAHLP
jgi:glucosamine-6-phosphate deaminase